MTQQIVVRYGEISLKGKNRSEFERILVRNLRNALVGVDGARVHHHGGRMMVECDEADADEVVHRLQRVFGVVSLSPAKVSALSVDAMAQAAVAVYRDAQTGGAKTFKVEVRRANKRFPIPSPELASELGGRILKAGAGAVVDVHEPDVTVFVEVRDAEAIVYGAKIPAVGGMPAGSAGRVGLLLSGGIDSPVAGWLAMKRGAELEAIHFHSYPFTSERALQKVEDLAQILADWGGRVRMHIVHFTDVQTEIRKYCPEALGITIMRRMMLRIAEEICRRRKLLALVTGESLGQVASQTLESMQTINAVTRWPILRPLVAEDKVDIMRRAREIGTYETSILPYEDCCTIFVPKNPRTRPRIDEAEAAEQALDIPRLVEEALARTEMKTFTARRNG
ncbi:putative tRNA sulfurtransferase [Alicyclobacillus contaminans]|uniref:tRNA uracil 4-sulfurtransferase ThiI n=1 Tax=Alicyclobacillus contaminans TaxID=392016 RepID=UPI00040EA52C|nr:tRNA uracil 4-sulfurtransferase ThiI [Alicyclobacillus contaminans]GMA49191.1 putative tRNA sulfurtransferase [Alicyclobacillus contaminans]